MLSDEWKKIIREVVAVVVTSALATIAMWWQSQNVMERVKKSENLIQQTVKEETEAVTEEAAKVAVGVAEKVAEAAAPTALEHRVDALEAQAEAEGEK